MKFGFSLIMRGAGATPEAFAAMGERADQLGIDSLWCSDHIVVPPRTAEPYPGRADGTLPEHWHEAYWEPFTVLAYLAARTKRVELGFSVCILSMRNPIEVAGLVSHLDNLSGGRITFGVGAGWFKEEYDILGVPYHERGARTNEGLAICKALWTQPRPSFSGRFYSFENVSQNPKPIQKPHPPIWIAGHTPAALKRVAKLGNGWHPIRPTFDSLKQGKAELARYLDAEGRSLDEITIAPKGRMTVQDGPPGAGQWLLEDRPQKIIDAIRGFQELGASHFILDTPLETLASALDAMERFAQEIRPKLSN
jgi:probable F420-dependent oxidoreductase